MIRHREELAPATLELAQVGDVVKDHDRGGDVALAIAQRRSVHEEHLGVTVRGAKAKTLAPDRLAAQGAHRGQVVARYARPVLARRRGPLDGEVEGDDVVAGETLAPLIREEHPTVGAVHDHRHGQGLEKLAQRDASGDEALRFHARSIARRRTAQRVRR